MDSVQALRPVMNDLYFIQPFRQVPDAAINPGQLPFAIDVFRIFRAITFGCRGLQGASGAVRGSN